MSGALHLLVAYIALPLASMLAFWRAPVRDERTRRTGWALVGLIVPAPLLLLLVVAICDPTDHTCGLIGLTTWVAQVPVGLTIVAFLDPSRTYAWGGFFAGLWLTMVVGLVAVVWSTF